MQYRQFDPNKDTLKVGLPIRLAGLGGEITNVAIYDHYEVIWENGKGNSLRLKDFPLLEIGEEPLTISKRLKEEIKNLIDRKRFNCDTGTCRYAIKQCDLEDWLDSLEVVD